MFYKWFFSLAILCFCTLGCQTIRYEANPSPLITTKKVPGASQKIHHEDDIAFYFWGVYPSKRTINLTNIAVVHNAKYGMSSVRIREEGTTLNFILSLLTLFFYAPRHIEIDALKNADIKE